MKDKVVITGMGIISPLGLNINEYWNNCLSGKSGIQKITRFDTTNFPIKVAGEIQSFNALDFISKKNLKRYPRYLQYIIAAVKEAIEDAHLKNLDNVAIIMGTGLGGFDILSQENMLKKREEHYRISPLFIPMFIPNMTSSIVSIEYKINGPSYSVNSACASSNHAMILGYNMIKMGYVNTVIVGGTESPIHPFGISSFSNLGLSSNQKLHPSEICRPFSKDRDGFILSEGAGVIILEKEESALKRNIPSIYCEMIGGSMSSDHYHLTAPDPNSKGIIKCLTDLISMFNIPKSKINYINAHGTSTKLGDLAEQNGIEKFFGKDLCKNIKINSTKSMTGHLLGAASIVEAITTIKSIEKNQLHPTINYSIPDPDCPLDCVPNKSIPFNVDIALSNGFGFGGQNSIIAMQSYYEK